MNKCDLEETKHLAIQKFIEAVETGDWTVHRTRGARRFSCGSFQLCYHNKQNGDHWIELAYMPLYVWNKTTNVEVEAAALKIVARHDKMEDAEKCQRILDALNPPPPKLALWARLKQWWAS